MGDHDEVGGKRLGWRKEARMEVGMRLLVECRRLKAKKVGQQARRRGRTTGWEAGAGETR